MYVMYPPKGLMKQRMCVAGYFEHRWKVMDEWKCSIETMQNQVDNLYDNLRTSDDSDTVGTVRFYGFLLGAFVPEGPERIRYLQPPSLQLRDMHGVVINSTPSSQTILQKIGREVKWSRLMLQVFVVELLLRPEENEATTVWFQFSSLVARTVPLHRWDIGMISVYREVKLFVTHVDRYSSWEELYDSLTRYDIQSSCSLVLFVHDLIDIQRVEQMLVRHGARFQSIGFHFVFRRWKSEIRSDLVEPLNVIVDTLQKQDNDNWKSWTPWYNNDPSEQPCQILPHLVHMSCAVTRRTGVKKPDGRVLHHVGKPSFKLYAEDFVLSAFLKDTSRWTPHSTAPEPSAEPYLLHQNKKQRT